MLIAIVFYLLIIPLVSYNYLKSSLKEEVFKYLVTTRDILYYQIHDYFHERLGDLDVIARNPMIKLAAEQFAIAFKNTGLKSGQYSTITKLYQPLMEHYCSDYGYANIFLCDKEGNVIYSVKTEEFSEANLKTGEYKDYSIGQAFRRGQEDVTFEDYTWNESLNKFTSFFAAPIYDKGEFFSVIIIEMPFSFLDSMLTHKLGLGKTGEMYLVGDDGFIRSNSRFFNEPTILTKEIDTEATRLAFDNYTGIKIIKDYRGVSVLSAYRPLHLKFVDWVLLVEIDKRKAFAIIRLIELRLIIIASIIVCISISYIVYITRKYKNKDSVE